MYPTTPQLNSGFNYSSMANWGNSNPNVYDNSGNRTGALNTPDYSGNHSTTSALDNQGSNWWGDTAAPMLNGASAIWQGWNGWQNTQIARDSLRENRRQFNMNWDAQRNLTNRQLHDQQQRKIAAQGGIREGQLTPDQYQMKWGIN